MLNADAREMERVKRTHRSVQKMFGDNGKLRARLAPVMSPLKLVVLATTRRVCAPLSSNMLHSASLKYLLVFSLGILILGIMPKRISGRQSRIIIALANNNNKAMLPLCRYLGT